MKVFIRVPVCLYVYFADVAHCFAQDGQLPLHHGNPWNRVLPGDRVLELLLDKYPEAAGKADKVGCEGNMAQYHLTHPFAHTGTVLC